MKRGIPLLGMLLISSGLFAAEVVQITQFSGLNTDENSVTLQGGQSPDSQNVITDRGTGVEGRKGFIRVSSQSAVDIWQFPLSNGTRYMIKRSSNTLLADTGAGTFSTFISTIPTDRKTVGSALGDRFYFANTTDGLKYWNGLTVSVASTSLTVTMLATWKGRLVAAGKTGEERVLRLSKYLDGTSWTAPANPSDDDAAIITVSGALDENIQAIYASFQDKLIWFKKSSFGGIYGSRRSNFSQRTFSDIVGVSAPETIQDCDGLLRWLGNNRKVYEFDGATFTKISDQVNTLFTAVAQGETASRSTMLTSQSDWEQGSSTPTGNLSTTITPGSVVISTMDVTRFTDNVSTDFAAGTLVQADTETSAGSLLIALQPQSVIQQQYGGDSGSAGISAGGTCGFNISQSFTTGSSPYFFTGLVVRLAGGGTGDGVRFYLYSDSGGLPSVNLGTGLNDISSSISSTPADYGIAFATVTLAANTRYWLRMTSSASPFAARTAVGWEYTSGSFSENMNWEFIGGCYGTTSNTKYKVMGRTYYSSATIVSRTYDVGFTTNTWLWNWGILSATTTLPSGGSITYETQSSSDSFCCFETSIAVVSGNSITSTVRRYLRYKAYLYTTNTVATPSLDSISLSTQHFLKSSGTYTTKVVSIGNTITAWGPLTIGDSVSGGNGTIGYQVQGSTNSSIALFNPSSWTAITSNSIPNISTAPYVAFRATFTATSAGTLANPLALNDVQFSWTEGSTVRAASGWIDQRYWLAVATTSPTNNLVYVYDRNKQWQRYVGINADCIGQYGSNFYFGNSTGVFKTEDGYSDGSSAITSYFVTKDFSPSGPDTASDFLYAYLTADQSDSSIATSYRIDGSTVAIDMGPRIMNVNSFRIQNFKVPFSLADATSGRFINLKWQVSGTSFWRLINADLYYNRGLAPQ